MPVPQVVIVGRPNVGKSSIFNWLAGKRLAIVDDQPGVTRDRVTHFLQSGERFFELVDTGGIGHEDKDNLTKLIDEQIETAIEQADVILFVVDVRDRIVPLDEEVSRRLRYVDKPIICLANKADAMTFDVDAEQFYKLGRGKVVTVSAQQNRGKDELLELIHKKLPRPIPGEENLPEPEMKVAIVGRRNVGKSTMVNTLAQAERMIVSEVPGTTRDSVDVRFELDGKAFIAIDTPGLTRTRAIRTDIDYYSTHRAQRSIRRADIVLMFFDPTERISKVDKQLVQYIAEQYKPCMFVVNKWDLLHGQISMDKWVQYLRDTFPTMWHVPIAFVTGQTGKNVKAMINHAQNLFKQSLARVGTGELNRVLRFALDKNPPPAYQNKTGKIYYVTQVAVQPPTVVLFCNDPNAFSPTYRRYLLGVFRDQLPFGEVPIKLYLQRRAARDERDEIHHRDAAEVAEHEMQDYEDLGELPHGGEDSHLDDVLEGSSPASPPGDSVLE